jgi:hypothetical protein
MEACAFDEDNHVFDPPKGMTNEDCNSLSAYVGYDSDKRPVTITCWKVSKEELEEIIKTGRIWLFIFGHGMPPVALVAKHPFTPTTEESKGT